MARCFSQVHTLTRYLQPINLALKDAQQIPTLQLKSEQYLLKNWWSEKPFDVPTNAPMNVPVFSFLTGDYLKKQIGTASIM